MDTEAIHLECAKTEARHLKRKLADLEAAGARLTNTPITDMPAWEAARDARDHLRLEVIAAADLVSHHMEKAS